jgi:hypothetical protein
VSELLLGSTPRERIAQGEAHCHYLPAAILRAPWAHMHGAPDHPGDCRGSQECRHERMLREQLDTYLDAILAERRVLMDRQPSPPHP